MIRSPGGTAADSALSSVVLPAPVPPEITTFSRARTNAFSSSTVAASTEPSSRSWASVNSRGKRRIVSVGPRSASGGMITFTRSPVGSRASTIGLDSSTRRLTWDTMRSIVWYSCASSVNVRSALCRRPSRSTQTSSVPLTMISVTVGSASSGSSTPRPIASSITWRISRVRSEVESTGPSRETMRPTTRSRRARRCGSDSSANSERSTSSSSRRR